jgi:hypothetical protein
MWIPPIALGLSMSRSDPWQASQEELSRSSSHPRNCSSACDIVFSHYELTFCSPSFRKDTVNIPLSTHMAINSAGSPPTLLNSMPC